jgi:hypothetical protein
VGKSQLDVNEKNVTIEKKKFYAPNEKKIGTIFYFFECFFTAEFSHFVGQKVFWGENCINRMKANF